MLFVVGSASAQSTEAFDRAHEQAAAARDATARASAARAAASAFLALPVGRPRSMRLLEGAEAFLWSGDAAAAAELVAEARAAGMANGRLARLAVATALRTRPFADAIATIAREIAAWPEDVRAALVADEPLAAAVAQKALRGGKTDAGRLVFEQLAAARPLAGYRIANLALCLRQLGEIEAARRQYQLALELAPTDLEVENDLGLMLRAQGDLPGAAAAFHRSWRLDLARGDAERARGPAITNLVHLAVTRPEAGVGDPLPDASRALAVRPEAAMLRRLVLDVAVDRVADRRPGS